MKYCPQCGHALANETAKFCDECGANIGSASSTGQPAPSVLTPQSQPAPVAGEEKSPIIAAICSLVLPGLGQVYDGKTERGFAIFFGTIIGLFIFILPGVIVWLFGIYDAYTIAQQMNNKEIPFVPTNTAHLIIFIIIAIAAAAIVFFLFMLMAFAAFAFMPVTHYSMMNS
ncbi:MAG: hypothetical protein WC342_08075 [Methanoregula sp.]|jgi:TM2 domain-containing membrane protein YozV